MRHTSGHCPGVHPPLFHTLHISVRMAQVYVHHCSIWGTHLCIAQAFVHCSMCCTYLCVWRRCTFTTVPYGAHICAWGRRFFSQCGIPIKSGS